VPNDALRSALAEARLTPRELAARIGVDEKTAGRWLAGRVPHPRHRWATADALGVDEAMIWPDIAKTALKTGHDREIVSVYPYRSAIPKSLWRDLISDAQRQLTFAAYTSYFLWLDAVPNLRGILRRKLEAGASVRFLLGDPDSPVTRQREAIERAPLTVSSRIGVTFDQLVRLRAEAPAVQARYSDRHIAMSVFAFDNDALVCTHLADMLGHDSPTLHLRRRGEDGLYDRYRAHAEHLWAAGREVWTDDAPPIAPPLPT
jgi:transcriptional regulator with XRE-family HTH domain